MKGTLVVDTPQDYQAWLKERAELSGGAQSAPPSPSPGAPKTENAPAQPQPSPGAQQPQNKPPAPAASPSPSG